MTTQPKLTTTPGIPTAKHHFPAGTSAALCIGHNRSCKVARMVTAGLAAGYDHEITDTEMDALAVTAGVRPPGGAETRAAVRAGLTPPFTSANSPENIAEAVADAATDGHPFQYRDLNGRTVLLVPLPVGE